MNLITGIGWILWAANVFLALSFIIGCRRSAAAGAPFLKTTALQTFLFTISAVIFLFLNINKLHLLWVIPIVFFGSSLITLGGIPLVSPTMLSLTNLFMAIILFGVRIDTLAYFKRLGSMSKEDIDKESKLRVAAQFDEFNRQFMKEHGLKNEEELIAYLEGKHPNKRKT